MQCVVIKPSFEAATHIDYLKQLLNDSLPSFTDSMCSVQVKDGIIEVNTPDVVEVAEIVSRFSGVAYAALAERVVLDFDVILQNIIQVGRRCIFDNERFTVKVESTQRINFEPKDLESLAISTLIGEVSGRGAKPDEKKPDKVVYTLLTKEAAYIFTHRYLGFGGFPCGSLGECVILIEPTVRSFVGAWLTQRTGFDAKYLIINRPFFTSKALYHSFEVFTLLRRCLPRKSVQVFYVDAAKYHKSGDVGLGYSWLEFTACLALKAAKEVGVKLVSLPFILGNSVRGVAEKACRDAVQIISPASFLVKDELLTYADKLGLQSKLQLDLDGNMLSVLDASGRPFSDIEGAIRQVWENALKIEAEKGILDAHEFVDRLA